MTTKSTRYSEDEVAAMKARAKELKQLEKMGKNKAEGERILLKAIDEMQEPDRSMAKRIHELVKEVAPDIFPKTWYSMPAYAVNDKVVCFFQSGIKFKSRYCTLGFTDAAKLDEGNMWAAGFALKQLTSTDEGKIKELVIKALG